jgi:hypothetical protein
VTKLAGLVQLVRGHRVRVRSHRVGIVGRVRFVDGLIIGRPVGIRRVIP